MTRCKFKVRSKSEYESGVHEIIMYPVIQGSEENKKFFKYTPGGEFKLSVVSPETAQMFEVGKEYYIDISLAE